MAKKYKTNFLKQVLLRIDFQTPLGSYEKGLYPKVEQTVQKRFPRRQEQTIRQQSFEINPQGQNMAAYQMQVYSYYSKDNRKHVRIEPTAFYIQYDKYNSFETLKKDIKMLLDTLVTHYHTLNITRIGLRYIDEFKIDESNLFNWKKYLNPKLYSIFGIPPKSEQQFISRALSTLEFNYGDHNLTLKYGMHNPDYPSPICQKLFILDSDAYSRDAIPESEALEVIEKLHDCISNLFEKKLIREGLRELMDGK